ncbi:MAG: hypothetical protein U9R74_14155 [Pseudomonadota bacterium]|nr:hypothetical protein [Pseudomonadota bacterium]
MLIVMSTGEEMGQIFRREMVSVVIGCTPDSFIKWDETGIFREHARVTR